MLDCTLSVLKKERKLFLEKVRFVLNFLLRSRFLAKLKFVKAGNWKNLWKSKANKRFWITEPLFCVIRYNVSNTWGWWRSNQRVEMRNRSSERCWKKTSRLIRREYGDGIDTSGLFKSQHDVQKQRMVRKLEDSKKKFVRQIRKEFCDTSRRKMKRGPNSHMPFKISSFSLF